MTKLTDEDLENVNGGFNIPSIDQLFKEVEAEDLQESKLLNTLLKLLWRN